MQYGSLEQILLAKPEAVKEFPFGPDTAVFKVGGSLGLQLGGWQFETLRTPDLLEAAHKAAAIAPAMVRLRRIGSAQHLLRIQAPATRGHR